MQDENEKAASEVRRYEIRSGALAETPHAGTTCVLMVFSEDFDRVVAERDEARRERDAARIEWDYRLWKAYREGYLDGNQAERATNTEMLFVTAEHHAREYVEAVIAAIDAALAQRGERT